MYEWNYFYGAILLDQDYASSPRRNYPEALDFIQNKLPLKNYTYFHPKIFSTATEEIPYSFEKVLISFGRTAKNLFYDIGELNEFIIEFEDILSNLGFLNAQVKTGGLYIDHSFFWANKKRYLDEKISYSSADTKLRIYESEQFYFGLGEMNLDGGWINETYSEKYLKSFDMLFKDFKYPIG